MKRVWQSLQIWWLKKSIAWLEAERRCIQRLAGDQDEGASW